MATMEPAGPRPARREPRIICDLIDVFERDLKASWRSRWRPQVGNYDAFHQANTALSPSLWGLASARAALRAWDGCCFTKSASSICPTDRLPRTSEKSEILSQLVSYGAALAQAKGPDLHGMARINAILAMKDRIATKTVGGDGKTRWVAAKPAPPLLARILAVAARYDALTSDREFRPAMSPEKTIQLMLRQPASLDGRLVRLVAKLKNVGTTPADSAAG